MKKASRKKSQKIAAVPLLKPWLADLKKVVPDLKKVWASGKLSLGVYTQKLEQLACRELGVKEAVAVSSCTSGMILALRALNIHKKVVVPDYTFPATSHVVLWNGGEPRFCDIGLTDFTISPEALAGIKDPAVEAVIAVNIFGLPPRISELQKICRAKGWKLIFDSAQGLGASYRGRSIGGFGEAEIFSLSPSKVVTSAEGGLITTNNSGLAERLRQLRDYGKGPDKEDMLGVGLSARMSELCAVVACHNFVQLGRLRREREQLVERYREKLMPLKEIAFQNGDASRASGHNYFVFRITERARTTRDQALKGLRAAGIECKRYFYPPLHRLSAYRGQYRAQCPNAEKLSEQALAVPLYSGMKLAQQDRVIRQIFEILGEP